MTQLSLWTKKEIDFFAPRKKTEREIKRELLEKKILERVVLSDEEQEKFNSVLNKKDLVEYFRKNYQTIDSSPALPQMTLTTLSQYSDKEQKDLLVSDLVVMYKSIQNAFPEARGSNELRKFRKANGMAFFGESQYIFMVNYVKTF